MTELLGNKFCIDNLRTDVGDIQTVLSSLTSRLGQVNYTSWKFPDKLAQDVDILELLEMCEFDAEYEEENKISHLLLLEMVIDRLLFFIQCSNRFTDQLFGSSRAQSAVDTQSSSIGVVTKKYWSKMLQLHSSNQQMQSDNKSQLRKMKELQSFNQEIQDELSKYHQGVTQVPTTSTHGTRFTNGSALPPISPQHAENTIAKDNSNKSSQTLETAFVACESCYKVQNCFKTVADSMSNLCKAQGLPSAIAKYRKQLKGLDWYSANDLSRWSVEQNKDLERINKHLSDLMSTIDPLKEELADTITSCRKLEQRVTECQREVEQEKETQRVVERQHVQKIETINKEHNEGMGNLESRHKQLEERKRQLETKIQEAKCDLELQMSKYQELDDVKNQLMVEFEELKTNNSDVKRLESILSSLEQEMTKTKEQLLDTEAQLKQEQAITKSLTKRTESLQSKYDSLVRRIGEMDDENTTLQSELSSLVEEKEQIEISLAKSLKHKEKQTVVEKIESEKQELRERIDMLEQTVGDLEQQLGSMKERERLIVEYPDLNGPVNSDVTGTGDIFTDMSNQVSANELRIELLNNQNKNMRKTLSKLTNHNASQNMPSKQREEETTLRYSSVAPMEPTALWKHSDMISHSKDQHPRDVRPISGVTNIRSDKDTAGRGAGDFVVGRLRENEPQYRHSSVAAQPSSGLDAYMKLKKAGLIKQAGRNKTEQGDPGSKSYCCPSCDKLYHSLADLEIHRSYCAARR